MYPPKGEKAEPTVDPDFARSLSSKSIEMSESEIQTRLMRAMTDEAKRVMDEKVCNDAEAIELAAQHGLGFQVVRGGRVRVGLNVCSSRPGGFNLKSPQAFINKEVQSLPDSVETESQCSRLMRWLEFPNG